MESAEDSYFIRSANRTGKNNEARCPVRNNLGEPVAVNSNGIDENWTYQYAEGQGVGETLMTAYGFGSMTQRSDILIITFSGNLVRDYNYIRSK